MGGSPALPQYPSVPRGLATPEAGSSDSSAIGSPTVISICPADSSSAVAAPAEVLVQSATPLPVSMRWSCGLPPKPPAEATYAWPEASVVRLAAPRACEPSVMGTVAVHVRCGAAGAGARVRPSRVEQ